MTWTVSTIIAEFFYCIIGLFFVSSGVKALKDPDCAKKHTPRCSGSSWLHLLAGVYLPRWITGACVVLMAAHHRLPSGCPV